MEILENLRKDIINTKSDSRSKNPLMLYFEIFCKYAMALMNSKITIEKSKMVGIKLRPVEIEFYVYYGGIFEDPFIHMDPMQNQFGKLYVHPMSRNRAGIDLTFGDKESCIFGGILLKSVEIEGNYICGQSKVRDKIEELLFEQESDSEKWSHEAIQRKFNILSIYIEKIDSPSANILFSKRVGLGSSCNGNNERKTEHTELNYSCMPYRFVSEKFLNKYAEKCLENNKFKIKMITDLRHLKDFLCNYDISTLNSDEFEGDKLRVFKTYSCFLDKYKSYGRFDVNCC